MSRAFRAWLLSPVIEFLHHLQRTITMTNDELLQRLTAVDASLADITTEVQKVGSETDSLQTEVQALKDEIAAAGGTTPAVDAALAAVEARAGSLAAGVKALDDKVPDPATP
jgi:hypothetical protein